VSAAPPRLARALLWLASPPADREVVEGDLREEFTGVVLPRRGARRARGWYWGQVLRSLAPLLVLRWQRRGRPPLLAGGAAALLGAGAPLLAAEALRRFVLSQVPLRAASEPSAAYLVSIAVLGVAMAVLGAGAGARWVRSGREGDR
jgi:hypothetical protein